ncbi:hypothetical protein GCM10023195_07100 [Actinoallomurus liliacearum]|uniref:Winged helix DNA-binding domain-containing protein n=1 Tax=Actinoallomurus liliacearum TaxID=1080073 RepID=A0ABP8TAA3_9ACTN
MNRDALLRQAKRLLEEQPRTRAELGKLLAEHWPDADPNALAYAATHHIALCQVPPRGVWGKNGPAAWAPVQSRLGTPLRSVPVDALVLRYLVAFGPAHVADIQVWSGLTWLREVVERLSRRRQSRRPAYRDFSFRCWSTPDSVCESAARSRSFSSLSLSLSG